LQAELKAERTRATESERRAAALENDLNAERARSAEAASQASPKSVRVAELEERAVADRPEAERPPEVAGLEKRAQDALQNDLEVERARVDEMAAERQALIAMQERSQADLDAERARVSALEASRRELEGELASLREREAEIGSRGAALATVLLAPNSLETGEAVGVDDRIMVLQAELATERARVVMLQEADAKPSKKRVKGLEAELAAERAKVEAYEAELTSLRDTGDTGQVTTSTIFAEEAPPPLPRNVIQSVSRPLSRPSSRPSSANRSRATPTAVVETNNAERTSSHSNMRSNSADGSGRRRPNNSSVSSVGSTTSDHPTVTLNADMIVTLQWIRSTLAAKHGDLTAAFHSMDGNRTKTISVSRLTTGMQDLGVSRLLSEAVFRKLCQMACCEKRGALSLQDWHRAFGEVPEKEGGAASSMTDLSPQ
jgi:hypothetical protein